MKFLPLFLLCIELAGANLFEGLRRYEIIRPIDLSKNRHRRDASILSSDLDEEEFQLRGFGQMFQLKLQKNRELLPTSFKVYLQGAEGLKESTEPVRHCYYHGHIVGDERSRASMSTCNGLDGSFLTSTNEQFHITPLNRESHTFGTKEQEHVLYRAEDVLKRNEFDSANSSSLFDERRRNTVGHKENTHSSMHKRSRRSPEDLKTQTKYVEMVLAADFHEYTSTENKNDGNLTKTVNRIVGIANSADEVWYSNYKVRLVITRVIIQESLDVGYAVTDDLTQTHSNFKVYNEKLVADNGWRYDVGALVSGKDFTGSPVGLATFESLCDATTVTLVQDWDVDRIGTENAFTHEIGHHFGFDHPSFATSATESYTTGGNANGDPCVIPFIYNGVASSTCIAGSGSPDWCATTSNYDLDNKFGHCPSVSSCTCTKKHNVTCPKPVMTAASYTKQSYFASCSDEIFSKRLAEGKYSCLFNYPDTVYEWCGDGFVGENEECDCGSEKECAESGADRCCNAATCKLQSNATCAPSRSSPCCNDECQLKPQGVICRANQSTCDLPEYCNGVSNKCSNDVYKQDGTSCGNDTSYCYNGKCALTHDEICHNLHYAPEPAGACVRDWEAGEGYSWGGSGTEYYVGKEPSKEACYAKCKERSLTDPRINAVAYKNSTQSCICEYNMMQHVINTDYVAKYFECPGVVSGKEECWEENHYTLGEYSNCGPVGKSSPETKWVACKLKDMKCGKMQCGTKNYQSNVPNWKTNFYYQDCVRVAYEPSFKLDVDPTYPADGVKCGEQQLCENLQCKGFDELGLNATCSSNCNGGICNSAGECHCPAGLACPHCDRPGEGGSFSAGSLCVEHIGCRDISLQSTSCSALKSNGDCNDPTKLEFMKYYCKKTCNFCDANECTDFVCHPNATCNISDDSSDTCACNPGLLGDGMSCRDPYLLLAKGRCKYKGIEPKQTELAFDILTFDTLGECKEKCNTDPTCSAIEYKQSKGSCYGLRDVGNGFASEDDASDYSCFRHTDRESCAHSNCHTHAVCYEHLPNNNTHECHCDVGFTGNNTNCTDIDECLEKIDNCHDHADCRNTNGSFECICRDGYHQGSGQSCREINSECLNATECHEMADCVDGHGHQNYKVNQTTTTRTCQCKRGYKGNGSFCEETGCYAVCQVDHSPVCSDDGTTYPNECVFNQRNCVQGGTMKIKHKGECRTAACTRKKPCGPGLGNCNSDKECIGMFKCGKVGSCEWGGADRCCYSNTTRSKKDRVDKRKLKETADLSSKLKDLPKFQKTLWFPNLPFEHNETAEIKNVSHFIKDANTGIAIFQALPSHGWRYNCGGKWLDVNVSSTISGAKSRGGRKEALRVFLLGPDDQISFKLDSETGFWSKRQAENQVFLRYITYNTTERTNSQCEPDWLNKTDLGKKTGKISALRLGCDGKAGSSGIKDACGVCGGRNKTCMGCDGVPNSGAKYDDCHKCVNGTTGKTHNYLKKNDCRNKCGLFKLDNCSKCQSIRGFKEDRFMDCAGQCNGKAKFECGSCVGGNTGNVTKKDACGVCNGDGTSCKDCAGVVNGKKKQDLCGNCLLKGNETWNNCAKIGNPNQKCAISSEVKLNIPAAGFNDTSKICCNLTSNVSLYDAVGSLRTLKGISSLRVKTIARPVTGQYRISCLIDKQIVVAPDEIFIIKKAGAKINSVQPNALDVSSKKSYQEVSLIGSGFVNSSSLACIAFKRSRMMRLRAVFYNSSRVGCYVPSSPRPDKLHISLSFCGERSTKYDKQFGAFLMYKAELPKPIGIELLSCSKVEVKFSEPISIVKSAMTCNKLFPTEAALLGSRCSVSGRGNTLQFSSLGDSLIKSNAKFNFELPSKGNIRYLGSAGDVVYPADTTYQLDVGNIEPSKIQLPKLKTIPSGDNTRISACQPYEIIAKSSKPNTKWVWSVALANAADELDSELVTAVANLNTDLFYQTSPKLLIGNADAVLLDVKLRFTVTVTDCLGRQVSQSVGITKAARKLPKLVVLNPEISSSVADGVRVKVAASRGCKSFGSNLKMEYRWEITPNVSESAFRKGWRNKKDLIIKPFSLKAGEVYTATISAKVEGTDDEVTAAAVITTLASPMTMSINAASATSIKGVLQARADVYDSDDFTNLPDISWTIATADGDAVYVNNSAVDLSTGALVNLDAAHLQLQADAEYELTAVAMKGARSVAASHKFKVFGSGEPPEVKVSRTLKRKWNPKFNPGNVLVIKGAISSKVTGSFEWSCVQQDGFGYVDLSSSALGMIEGNYGNTRTRRDLVIERDALIGGTTYQFVLSATNEDSDSSVEASIEVETIETPSAGELTVSPANGTALDTQFSLSVDGCEHTECVKYRFMYRSDDDSFETKKRFQEVSSVDMQLPPGRLAIRAKCVALNSKSFRYTPLVYIDVAVPTMSEADKKVRYEAAKNTTADLINQGRGDEVASELTKMMKMIKQSAKGGQLSLEAKTQQVSFRSDSTGDLLNVLAGGGATTDEGKTSMTDALTYSTEGAKGNFDPAMIKNVLAGVETLFDIPTNGGKSRRAVDCGVKVAEQTKDDVEKALEIQTNTISPSGFTADDLANKANFLSTLDSLSSQFCKSGVSGGQESASKGIATIYTLKDFESLTDFDEHKDFGQVSVQLGETAKGLFHTYDCCADDDGKSGFGDDSCIGACLSAAQMPEDLLSVNNGTALASGVVRIKLWNPSTSHDLEADELASGVVVKLFVSKPMNVADGLVPTYRCVSWDPSNNNWTSASHVSTVDRFGEMNENSGQTFVSCNITKLTYVALLPDDTEVACHESATRLNGACMCNVGFSGNGTFCVDINHCINVTECHERADCVDGIHNYTCQCKPGNIGNGTFCDEVPCHGSATRLNGACTCNYGYSGNGTFCVEVCHDSATRLNGKCKCNKGYSGNGTFCIEINNCLNDKDCHDKRAVCELHGCPTENGFCVLMNATSAECRCDNNYLLVNGTCRKSRGIVLSMAITETYDDSLNDSSTPQFVALAAKVEKALDGYLRTQNITGYVGVQVLSFSPGSIITDFSILIMESSVINTTTIKDIQNIVSKGVVGGQLDNIKVDKSRAIDINECYMDRPCHAAATCTNTMSNYTCACNSGYHGSGIMCTDLDECTNGTHNCHVNATCENTVGAFKCQCIDGYDGDGRVCKEDTLDLSNAEIAPCHKSATRQNGTCKCNYGYSGNGTFCVEKRKEEFKESGMSDVALMVVVVVVCLLVIFAAYLIYKRHAIRAWCVGGRRGRHPNTDVNNFSRFGHDSNNNNGVEVGNVNVTFENQEKECPTITNHGKVEETKF